MQILIKAVAAGDQATAQVKDREWYQNADEIVTFLNHINPFIDLEHARAMFYRHLDLTKKETTLMINKNFEQDIETFDIMQEQGEGMADDLTEAIIKQFPNRFL